MKKKLMLCAAAIIAAATLSLTSCSKNPADKVISLYENAAKQVKNADSRDEIKEIDDKLNMEVFEIAMKNKDFEPTDAQKDAVKDAQKAYNKAKREAQKNL